jgi:LysM repeat protein
MIRATTGLHTITLRTLLHRASSGIVPGMRHRLLLTLMLGLLIIQAIAPSPTTAQSPASQIIQLVNALRASRGLPAFTPNGSLMAAAQSHAEWMAANTSYTHTGAGGSRPQDRATNAGFQGYVSENIVGGTNLSPQQGVIWWENSAIHYQTMTSTRHIYVGAGYASNGSQNMYVLVVGVPSDYAPAPGSTGSAAAEPEDVPLIVIPVERSDPREDGSIVHEVQIGQTAWDIAAVYDVDLATLLALNYLTDDPILLPGDEIIVRPPDGVEMPTRGPLTHRVQEGQTLWAIAARYNMTLDDLLWLNSLTMDTFLQPGDELIIRLAEGQAPPPTPTPVTSHIVRSGETLWDIALRYNLSLEDLLAFNGIAQDTLLQPGDELRIRPPEVTPTLALPPAITEVAAMPRGTLPPPTAAATMTAFLAPPTATPTPGPTSTHVTFPTATPVPSLPDVGQDKTLVGALVVALGVIAMLGMGAIEVAERLRKR